MPKKICPVCQDAYIHFKKKYVAFGKDTKRTYNCDECGDIIWDLKTDTWIKGTIEEIKKLE